MGFRLHHLVEVGALSGVMATIFGVLVFLGPAAKLARFSLHTWLPDAKELVLVRVGV